VKSITSNEGKQFHGITLVNHQHQTQRTSFYVPLQGIWYGTVGFNVPLYTL